MSPFNGIFSPAAETARYDEKKVMRIGRRTLSPEQARRLSEEIAEAAAARGVDGRVCGETCTFKCESCGSACCQCSCSRDCPDAPKHLSSDPDKYPIEVAITPLVYEMKRLDTFRPCWSCEGHVRADGSLWKLPRVWFYCDSVAHIRLLADGIEKLRAAGRLSAPWQVVVTFSDPDNPDTSFSLEPVPMGGDQVTLSALQGDIAQIAGSLESIITEQARQLQSRS